MKSSAPRVKANPKTPSSATLRLKSSAQTLHTLEKKVLKFKKLYSFISEISQLIIRSQDEKSLFEETCHIATRIGKFRMAWIGVLDSESKRIIPLVYSGYEKGYLEKVSNITANQSKTGKGPTGEALRKGQLMVCNDISTDPRMIPWKKEAIKRNYHSSIALPIKKSGKVYGAISIYAEEKSFFNKDEIKLLKEAVHDISFALDVIEKTKQQMKSAEEIRLLYEIYEKVSLATSDTIWDWDLTHNTLRFNKGISAVYGYPESSIITDAHWRELQLHPADLKRFRDAIQYCFDSQQQTLSIEYRFRDANNKYKFIFDRAFIVYVKNRPVRMIGAMQDITFQKEEELRLAKTIIKAQEAERHFIGQELHDNVNQILVAAQLNLGLVKKLSPERLPTMVDTIKGYIGTAINEIRNLSHQLSPSSFGDVTLKDVFENLLQGINADKKYTLQLHFDTSANEMTDKDIQITLYRILQEALNNIIKHAYADRIEVEVRKSEKAITMRITDNGIGFNPHSTKKGIGLSNIKRRVESFEGTFNLTSSKNKGCEVLVQLPLN